MIGEAEDDARGCRLAWSVAATPAPAHRRRHLRELGERVARHPGRLSPEARAIVEAIGADLARRVTLQTLGRQNGRSPSRLNARFRRETGLTIREYALYLRMTKAAEEIERGVKIDAVALLVGFRSRKNFYRQFEAWFGVAPGAFRGRAGTRAGP